MSTFSGQIRCKKFVSYSKLNKFIPNGRASWRLSPYRYSTFNRAYFVAMAAADAGITEEQMSAALRAYQTQFDQLLLNGHSLQMEGLGNFRLSCSMSTAEDVEDVNMDLFKRLRVVLRPSKELSNEIKSVQHIVDAPVSARSGDGNYILNYRLPLSLNRPSTPGLAIYPAPNSFTGIDVAEMTNLFFIVNHPDYGDIKLTAQVAGTGLNFVSAAAQGMPQMSINFIPGGEDSTYLDLDEILQIPNTCTIKMFGGQ